MSTISIKLVAEATSSNHKQCDQIPCTLQKTFEINVYFNIYKHLIVKLNPNMYAEFISIPLFSLSHVHTRIKRSTN